MAIPFSHSRRPMTGAQIRQRAQQEAAAAAPVVAAQLAAEAQAFLDIPPEAEVPEAEIPKVPEAEVPKAPEEPAAPAPWDASMNKAELTAAAVARGLVVPEGSTRAEIMAILRAG